MGVNADFWLSVACFIPLTATNWPKLRRIFANPRLQSTLGGDAVIYPNRCIPNASTSGSATELDCTASTAAAAESGGGAERAAARADESDDSEQDEHFHDQSDFVINMMGHDAHAGSTSTELPGGANVKMHNFFRSLPGFDADDDSPLTAAEHKAALTEFERRFNRKQGVAALLFEFPVLNESISARCENLISAELMSVGALGEQMACAQRQLVSFGFALDDIHMRSNMRCG